MSLLHEQVRVAADRLKVIPKLIQQILLHEFYLSSLDGPVATGQPGVVIY